jgi:RNA recognition motif. (a.k.a. RRM, RBD, or RNP domain)
MNINDEHLRQVFSTYGELVSVKIPAGKKCAFVQFANRFVTYLSDAFV